MVKIQIQYTSSINTQVVAFEDRVIANGGTFEAAQCCIEYLKTLGDDIQHGGYLDVKEGTAFPLNFSVGDIRDLSKRNGTFSKTITLVGNKNNHNILGHHYDVNIQDGTFNINTITKCTVLQNNIPIIEDALLQLVNVRKSQMTDAYEQMIEYEVLVKDSQAEFYTAITNNELTDLDFSDLNHSFSASTIYNSFNNTVSDGYKYLLPYKNSLEYSVNELKPAIYAKTYFDRIFSNAGFTYDWTGLSAAHFDKLIIPYNGDVNDFDYNDFLVEASNTWTTSYVQPLGLNNTFSEVITGWNEITDVQSLFTPLTGEYSTPFTSNPLAGQFYQWKIELAGTLVLDNSYTQTAKLLPFGGGSIAYNRYRIFAKVNVAGFGNGAVYGDPVVLQYTAGSPLPIGSTVIQSISTTLDFSALFNSATSTPVINASDIQILSIGVEVVPCLDAAGTITNTFGHLWVGTTSGFAQVDPILDLTSINLKVLPSDNIQVIGGIQEVNDFVPLKVKQSDFVKSIFQMYNLYVDIDPNQPNKLIFNHRDEFYDSGAERDWTYKLMKDREQNLLFLPDVTNKKLKLTYKEDTDSANAVYTQMTNEIYGQIEYTFDNEYVKDTDTKELIFSPTPVTRTPFNAYVPMISGQSPSVNIRICYDGGQQSCNQWNLIENGSNGIYGIQEYPAIGHFDNPLTPTFDINFGTCDYYFYQVPTLTANNLYNLYWRRTVNQINVGKMLTAYFDLREDDIQIMKLNDKIRIDNSWWNINKVVDYDANNTAPTKVELISIDSDIDLAPFQTAPGTTTGGNVINDAVTNALRSATTTNNVVLNGADVIIRGQGNAALPNVRGLIIGDGNTLDQDGIITPRINGILTENALIQYTKYTANITQVGTSAPTVGIFENSLTAITWTRTSKGNYLGTPLIPFVAADTFVTISSVQHDHLTSAYINTDGNVVIQTTNTSNHQHEDGILKNSPLEIRVYE